MILLEVLTLAHVVVIVLTRTLTLIYTIKLSKMSSRDGARERGKRGGGGEGEGGVINDPLSCVRRR